MKGNNKISYRNLIILIVVIILLIIIGISITMARYKSTGETTVSAEVAFYVVEEGYQAGNIMLSDLYPREEAFEYELTVANNDGTNTAETSIDYSMDLKITTNLPLEFEIYKNGSKLTDEEELENNIVLDESNQCYIRQIKVKKGSFIFNQTKTDTYKISAKFPTEYNEIEEYEGMIDHVSIILDSKQKID